MYLNKITFYNLTVLNMVGKMKLLDIGFKKSMRCSIDVLDRELGPDRKGTDMTYSQVMRFFGPETYVVMFDRMLDDTHNSEIRFVTHFMDKTYYLYLELKPENLYDIIEQFNLTVNE